MTRYELEKRTATEPVEMDDGSYMRWAEQRPITTVTVKRDGKPVWRKRLDGAHPMTVYQVRDLEELVAALNRE